MVYLSTIFDSGIEGANFLKILLFKMTFIINQLIFNTDYVTILFSYKYNLKMAHKDKTRKGPAASSDIPTSGTHYTQRYFNTSEFDIRGQSKFLNSTFGVLILVYWLPYRHLQHSGCRRYAVGYPVQVQEHAADGRLEAHAFGWALGSGR